MNLNIPDNAYPALEFFYFFARFEYALKATGFCINRNGAEPDWNRFSQVIEPAFINPEPFIIDSIRYISQNPPLKQVFHAGHLEWVNSEPQTSRTSEKLLIYVRRVRNNLFHGGKFSNGYFDNTERNSLLLLHCTNLLHYCLLKNSDLEVAFNN